MLSVKQKYKFAVIAADVAVFTIIADALNVLLMKMQKKPYKKAWALPGGLIRGNESLEDAAKRQLLDKTGVRNLSLEQLYAFGNTNRDPFGRVVSVAYMALVPAYKVFLQEQNDSAWFPLKKLPQLAYDHKEIIASAHTRLKMRIQYTALAKSILPHAFTLSELQRVYEIILEREVDKRNFRKKLFALDLVEKTKNQEQSRPHRPARLYRFQK